MKFKCPHCGAAGDTDREETTAVTCLFCGHSFYAIAPQPPDTLNKCDSAANGTTGLYAFPARSGSHRK